MTDLKELNEEFLAAGSRVIAAYEAEDLEALMQATMGCMDIVTQVANDAAKSIKVAVAQRDALQAEVEQLRACLPKWRVVGVDSYGHTDWELSGNHYGAVLQPKGEGIPIGKMRELERMRGFPECEVVE